MQTFLPHKSFSESAYVLDMKRLGKQRVEAYQILKALLDSSYGWQNHPAIKMWRGYEFALIEYILAVCNEWTSRGYKDSIKDKVLEIYKTLGPPPRPIDYPKYLGDRDFHNSHRSNLLRKDLEFYNKYNWDLPDNLPYIWPV